jgi:polyketide cyclase/dehydrase/lipid transport protein
VSVDLIVTQAVAARPERVWRLLTDWSSQRTWVIGTAVTVTGGDGASVGSTLSARTGYGAFGFTDPMEITLWDDDARRCVVRHLGSLVRGEGEFRVTAVVGGAEVWWSERLELPYGPLGRTGWPVVRPVVEAGLRVSLRRFAHLCETTDGFR